MINYEDKIGYTTIKVIDREWQAVEGLVNIYLRDSATNETIGGYQKFAYKLVPDRLGIPDGDMEFVFYNSEEAPAGYTYGGISTTEIGDGFYKIAYDLKGKSLEKVKIIIDDIEEEEYSEELIIDFDRTNHILSKSRDLSDSLNINRNNGKVSVNFFGSAEQGRNDVKIDRYAIPPDTIASENVKFSINFHRNIESINPEIAISAETIQKKTNKLDAINKILPNLNTAKESLADKDNWEETATPIADNTTAVIGKGSKELILSFPTTPNPSSIDKDDFIIIGDTPFSVDKVEAVAGSNNLKITTAEYSTKTINKNSSTTNCLISKPGDDSYGLLENLKESLENKLIADYSDVFTEDISSTLDKAEILGSGLQVEKKITGTEIRERVDYLQKSKINSLPDLHNIFNLMIKIPINGITPKFDLFTKKARDIIGFEIGFFLFSGEVSAVRSSITNLISGVVPDQFPAIIINNRDTLTVKNYSFEKFMLRDKGYTFSEISGFSGNAGDYYLSTSMSETFNNSFSNLDQYGSGGGNGSIILIDNTVYDIHSVDTVNRKVVLYKPLHRTVLTSDIFIKRSKYQEYSIPIFSGSHGIFHKNVSVNDRYIALIRCIDREGISSTWSYPVLFDINLLPLENNTTYLNLAAFIASFTEDNLKPVAPPIISFPSVRPPVVLKADVNLAFYDSMTDESTTASTIEENRIALETALNRVALKEASLKKKNLDYITAFDNSSKLGKLQEVEDETDELKDALNSVLDMNYLVNFSDNPVFNRYFCRVVVTNEPPVFSGPSSTQTVKKYRCKLIELDTNNGEIEGSEKIFDGPENLPIDHNVFTDKYVYSTKPVPVGGNTLNLSPQEIRTIRVPILPDKKYRLYISVVNDNGLSSAWSEALGDDGIITFSSGLDKDSKWKTPSIIQPFIDAAVKIQSLSIEREVMELKNTIANSKQLYENISTEIRYGRVISEYGTNDGYYYGFKLDYDNTADVQGFLLKAFVNKDGEPTFWKNVALVSKVEYEQDAVDTGKTYPITWTIYKDDDSSILKSLILALYATQELNEDWLNGVGSSGNEKPYGDDGFTFGSLVDTKLASKIQDAGWSGSDLNNDAKNARNFITFKVEMLTLQQFAFLKNSILK